MSKVGHFADGWQNKSRSKEIRERGDAARKATHAAEKARMDSAKSVQKVVKSQVNHASKRPVSPGKDVDQTHQRIRPETQDQASRQQHAKEAASEHVKASQDAKNLHALSTKATTPKTADKAQTREAVATKADAEGSNVKQNAADQKQPAVANQAAQAGAETAKAKKPVETKAAKTKAAKPKTAGTKKKGEQGKGAKAAKNAKPQAGDAKDAARTGALAQNAAAAAGAAGAQGVVEIKSSGADDVESSEDEGLEEDRDQNTSSFAKGSKVRSTKKELGGVLGGFSGDAGSGEGDGEVAEAQAKGADEVDKLPEKDPDFHVYSEFDEANPGVEHVKARQQVYARLVEKRIGEIAKLDQELDGKIKDIFETTPLSTRIVGDLAGELETADFLKSVYGGLIG